jgi:acetylornithine deacetylase/succinyl-diaminopimelate desuccinylase-like protein
VNPHGDPGFSRTGEWEIAEWVLAFLQHCGAQAELREVLPGRPNVIGHWPAPGKPRLLFAPHLDTVSVAGMKVAPFGGEVREGRLYGRGACDTKGSMASMLWALWEARETLANLSHEIWFAGLVGEEAGQQGAKALAAQERFDFVIAGEPTNLDVVYTHKGCTHLVLTTTGRAAHAARLELGENAIYKMADVIRYIRDSLALELRQHRSEVLGGSTISVGTVTGGSKTNIVPDRCEATVDIRTVPDQDGPEFLGHLERRLKGICADLEIRAGQSHSLYTDPAHPIIGKLNGLGARNVGAPWFCDAAVFAAEGTPAIAMGPGSIAQAHTEDEWIEVAEVERGVEFFKAFLGVL